MKILIVSEITVPSLYRSYRADPLAKFLSEMGHDVSVLCPWSAASTETLEYSGIRFFPLALGKRGVNPASRSLSLALMIGSLRRLLIREDFDVIRPISFLPGFASAVAARGIKVPIVTNLSDFYSDLYQQFDLGLKPLATMILMRMEEAIVRRSAVLMVDTPVQRLYWKRWGLDERRCLVLVDGVYLDRFERGLSGERVRAKYGIDSDAKIVYYHGDISRLDGVDVLIEAAPSIVERIKNVRFMIVGSGRDFYMKQLREKIENLGVGQFFVFTGWVPYSSIYEYLASADLCVAPFRLTFTSNSNFPMKIKEYIAAGKPIVSTKGEGIVSMVGDLVRYAKPNNPAMLADVLVETLDRGEELSKDVRGEMARIAERLDWKNIVKHEEKVLSALLEGGLQDYRVFDYMFDSS